MIGDPRRLRTSLPSDQAKLISVIVETASRSYGAGMVAVAIRMLTLLALVIMPFGMAGAPATAQSRPADHSAASTGHCDEQSGEKGSPVKSAPMMHCAMCVALPAAEAPKPRVAILPGAPRAIAAVTSVDGIELEIATPPPKRA
jgi:hypothetical protein